MAGLTLMGATILAALAHIGGAFIPFLHSIPSGVLIARTAFLPALGAALAGISNQGEFRRISKRSAAMAEHLKDLEKGVAPSTTAGVSSHDWQSVSDQTASASHLMINEVLDWRVVFLDRPLNPPS